MNLHPIEKRALLEDEEIIESWPRSMPNSPIFLVRSKKLRGIGVLWIVISHGAEGLQILWPGWLRLVFHRGVYLVIERWIYVGFYAGRAYFGFMKPQTRWVNRNS